MEHGHHDFTFVVFKQTQRPELMGSLRLQRFVTDSIIWYIRKLTVKNSTQARYVCMATLYSVAAA